jgi:uncharacterized membrane protein
MANPHPASRLRDYTNVPLEIVIGVLTVAPILILVYFYPTLPARIPVFLNFKGEVEVWADKSVMSVFRLPLMAVDLQLTCLLMKYGMVHFKRAWLTEAEDYRRRSYALSVGMWDWFRGAIAFKMCAESLSILFINNERLGALKTAAWAIAWIASILGVAGALVYAYRLMAVKREMKKTRTDISPEPAIDKAHVYSRFFYYNPSDTAMFVDKYGLNFGNKWSYALIGCLVAYPLLVFWTSK